MTKLEKLYVAYFYGKESKAFNIEKVVAESFLEAEDKAAEWGEFKYPNRVKKIVIERSKGEVLV
jgi:hypothetical protein